MYYVIQQRGRKIGMLVRPDIRRTLLNISCCPLSPPNASSDHMTDLTELIFISGEKHSPHAVPTIVIAPQVV